MQPVSFQSTSTLYPDSSEFLATLEQRIHKLAQTALIPLKWVYELLKTITSRASHVYIYFADLFVISFLPTNIQLMITKLTGAFKSCYIYIQNSYYSFKLENLENSLAHSKTCLELREATLENLSKTHGVFLKTHKQLSDSYFDNQRQVLELSTLLAQEKQKTLAQSLELTKLYKTIQEKDEGFSILKKLSAQYEGASLDLERVKAALTDLDKEDELTKKRLILQSLSVCENRFDLVKITIEHLYKTLPQEAIGKACLLEGLELMKIQMTVYQEMVNLCGIGIKSKEIDRKFLIEFRSSSLKQAYANLEQFIDSE